MWASPSSRLRRRGVRDDHQSLLVLPARLARDDSPWIVRLVCSPDDTSSMTELYLADPEAAVRLGHAIAQDRRKGRARDPGHDPSGGGHSLGRGLVGHLAKATTSL